MPDRHITYKPPDGGWGWVIVFSSFLLQALTVGVTYTFGIIYVDLLDTLKNTESVTAWIGSIQPALLYFTCVVTGPSLIRFGWRLVNIFGTLISAAGFFLSYFATSVYTLYVTYGVLIGIGYGVLYMVSMITVQHYFDRRRSLATGIAVSGSGLGTVAFGILIGQLLKTYHWRTAVLIEGLITIAIGLLCTCLIRPLKEEDGEVETERDPLMGNPDASHPSALHYGSMEIPSTEIETPTTASSGSANETDPNTDVSVSGSLKDEGKADKTQVNKTSSSEDVSSQTSFAHTGDSTRCGCYGCKRVLQKIDQKFQFSLCRSPILVVYCFTVICFCFGYHVPYTYTTNRAKVMFHIVSAEGSLLISIMGIANVSSRLVFGWVGDNSPTFRLWLLGSVITLCGVLNSLIFLFTNFSLLVIYSILFGALSGSFASLVPVVLVDQMGVEVMEYTLGQMFASSSIAFLLASPMSGLIIEKTGSYDSPFIVVGVAQIVGGLAFFTIPLIRRCWPHLCNTIVTYDEQMTGKHRRPRLISESFA